MVNVTSSYTCKSGGGSTRVCIGVELFKEHHFSSIFSKITFFEHFSQRPPFWCKTAPLHTKEHKNIIFLFIYSQNSHMVNVTSSYTCKSGGGSTRVCIGVELFKEHHFSSIFSKITFFQASGISIFSKITFFGHFSQRPPFWCKTLWRPFFVEICS